MDFSAIGVEQIITAASVIQFAYTIEIEMAEIFGKMYTLTSNTNIFSSPD